MQDEAAAGPGMVAEILKLCMVNLIIWFGHVTSRLVWILV